jgi:hypothetical protein
MRAHRRRCSFRRLTSNERRKARREGQYKVEPAKIADDKRPAWRWVVFIIFFVLFPIVFKPWWLAIICIAVFSLLMVLLYPGN